MTVPVQLRLDKDLFEHIRRTARMQAATEDRDIDWRDILRQALEEKFPIPKKREKATIQK